jgi:AraC-like DNA-binding protein
MHFTESTSVVNLIILGIHVFAQLAAAILIYIKHHEPYNRSWKYIFGFFVVSAIASTIEIALVINQAFAPQSYKLLDPFINIPGFYIFAILLCYVIELIRPYWLNLKRLILILLPSLIAAAGVLFFVAKGDITVLSSMRELKEHIAEPNVIARMVFLGMYIPYAVYLIAVRIRITANQASKFFDILVAITVCLCLSYVLSRGLQLYLGYIIHEILYLLLSVVIVYFEHYERLHVPLEKVRDYYRWDQLPHTTQNTVDTVAQALQKLMDDPAVWQDSELTGDKIVHLVGTNRTYIQQAAKQLGFASLSDMLNRRRIDYVCQQLRKDPNTPVQTLFVDAGYRSRTTAWRHFTSIVGCTPREFVERQPDKKEK